MLRARDPAFIRKFRPFVKWYAERYFRAEVDGIENVIQGASILVGTHNGGMHLADTYAFANAFWDRFGTEMPAYGLMHRVVSAVPPVRDAFLKLGALPASPEAGDVVLRAGHPLLVLPGGDLDALKPFRDRHRIVFGPRRGFVRLAIRHGAPIVPIVSVGAHEVLFILNDGEWLARLLGLRRFLRIAKAPLAFSFPFGLTVAGLPSLPLPSKVHVRVLPPIRLAEPPRAANDAAAVERAFEHVRSVMQRGLDELASGRKRPILG
jgi:1-acyl-sn-glycerol-3-phosphate acyltransferase